MSIRIVRNEQGNCIQFEGTTLPVYWNSCLSARINPNNGSNLDVINDIETGQTGIEKQEITNIHYTEFLTKEGNSFDNVQEVVDYIIINANVTGVTGNGIDLNGTTVDFKLDNTSTSIMLDNGYNYGVNTIKAIAHSNGTIHIVSEQGSLDYFTYLNFDKVTINGLEVPGGLNDVVNTLNELFTVGAFESVVIADPYSTMVADISGVTALGALVGPEVLDPMGQDEGGSNLAHYNNAGWLSSDTIENAGEYFSFDIRVEGIIGMGLVV